MLEGGEVIYVFGCRRLLSDRCSREQSPDALGPSDCNRRIGDSFVTERMSAFGKVLQDHRGPLWVEICCPPPPMAQEQGIH